jgi:urease accessory protein
MTALAPLSRALALAGTLLLPSVAWAHTGAGAAHGFGEGFAHPFGGLDHLLAMVTVGLFAATLGGRALWAVPLAFMGVMAAGGVLALAGVGLPAVELGIALSIVVLGLAVAAPLAWPLPAAMALVGAFALFHGHAHGTEMPADASRLAYGAGFLAATGLLHLSGLALGLALGGAGRAVASRARLAGGAAITLAGVAVLGGLL